MKNVITANLPSRDFDKTEAFYAKLGFETRFRNAIWLIMGIDETQIEFFPHPKVDPTASWFSACLRTRDIETLHARFSNAGLSTDSTSIPRLTGIFKLDNAPRMFALVDEDGSLWRILDETDVLT